MKDFLNDEQRFANDLIDFIHASPGTFQVVRNIKAALLRKGYTELLQTDVWQLEKEGKYFVTQNDTSLVAFVVGSGEIAENGFRIIAAHTDSPTLKIKPTPEFVVENSYLKLNVEVYGGPILSTWFDRPLSLAGRVNLLSKNPLLPEVRYVTFKRPLLVIPNLAIHLNREVNDGVKIQKNKHILPLLASVKNTLQRQNYLVNMLAEELKTEPSQIIDFDLFLYEVEKGTLSGANNEFISCSRLDNLAMIHASFEGLFTSNISSATQVMVCFDNEEIGSSTRQGAASPFLKNILERIVYKLNGDKEEFLRAIHNSFMISADMAHALHPNYEEMSDGNNKPLLNAGPVIKYNASQKYTSDSNSASVFEMLCRKAKVPVQKYTNRSDLAGGSTLGSIATSQLEMRMVDVGNPLLAMHSIRELSGVYDHTYLKNVFHAFYNL